ncbi:MAG: hypothetical protein AB7N71_11815 [Phycisphaerae bacterium]
MIAPSGVTWLTRWEQVRFVARDATSFAEPVGDEKVDTLADLLLNSSPGAENVSIWCTPALRGMCAGDIVSAEINAGQIGVQQRYLMRFRAYPGCTFAPIMAPTAANDPDWGQDVRDFTLQNIGIRFWQRGWTRAGWRETPYVSFSVVLCH